MTTTRVVLVGMCAVVGLLGCPGPAPAVDGGLSVAPVINALSPTTGPQAGGTLVTITGANFRDGASVTFGEASGTETVVTSAVKLTVKTPAHTGAGIVAVWVKNPDGQATKSPTSFEYATGGTGGGDGGSGLKVDEAVLENAALVSDTSGAATVTVTVRANVQAGTVTKGAGQGAGVRAEVGYATTVSSPPVEADFTWSAASYVDDVDGAVSGDKARDRYGADVVLAGATTSAPVKYVLAARFSVDQGATWVIADRDGSANGVLADQLAHVELTNPLVDWCKLGGEIVTAPPSVTLRQGEAGPTVYAQVYRLGTTDQAGSGGLLGELGYGTAGTAPSTWSWDAGVYNKDTGSGANDEYQATLPNPGAGTVKFAFRFRMAAGPWLYCDADGSTNGFDEAQGGTLVVQPPGLEGCTLQHVSATSVQSGAPVTAYVRVMVSGLSPDAGPTPGLRAQFGVGTQGDDARTSPEWGWREARFGSDIAATGEDEFTQDFALAYTGTRAVAARVSMDDGGTWLGCDTDGSLNGYDVTKQWGVAVTNHTDFAWCNTQWPATADAGTLIYGRASRPGLTPDGGAPIVAELGVGPKVQDPGIAAAWSWTRATFNTVPADQSNEYRAALPPAAAGLSFAFRFSTDAGAACYGDLNASTDGFSGDFSGAPNLGVVAP